MCFSAQHFVIKKLIFITKCKKIFWIEKWQKTCWLCTNNHRNIMHQNLSELKKNFLSIFFSLNFFFNVFFHLLLFDRTNLHLKICRFARDNDSNYWKTVFAFSTNNNCFHKWHRGAINSRQNHWLWILHTILLFVSFLKQGSTYFFSNAPPRSNLLYLCEKCEEPSSCGDVLRSKKILGCRFEPRSKLGGDGLLFGDDKKSTKKGSRFNLIYYAYTQKQQGIRHLAFLRLRTPVL